MIKLTRLNNNVVAINADCIAWADASPDTTLFLTGGEKIIVRESLDELIYLIVEFRRSIRIGDGSLDAFTMPTGDAARISVHPQRTSGLPRSISERPSRPSAAPYVRRGLR